MAKKILGDACAYIPGVNGGKNRYLKIGMLMQDERARYTLKIDTLPLPGTGWEGWVNVFDNKNDTTKLPVPKFAGPSGFDDMEDDIPF